MCPQSAKKERGDGPVLFKHGWISLSLFQGERFYQVPLPAPEEEDAGAQLVPFCSSFTLEVPQLKARVHAEYLFYHRASDSSGPAI